MQKLIKTLFLGLVVLLSGWFNPVQATPINLSSEEELTLFKTVLDGRLSVAELSGLSPPENLSVLSGGASEKTGAWEKSALKIHRVDDAVVLEPELVDSWRFLDEAGVDETLRRNIDALADPDAALDAIQMSQKAKPTWPEIQALWKRGNDYNAKARLEYGDNRVEVVLKGVDGKAGKRLDTYLPPENGQAGQIISRKATTLSEIQPNTFKNYLNELITKYPKGAELNSSKFPSGTTLDGDYFLEIPTSNKSFFESSAEFQKVLSDFNTSKGVDIKIKYLDE